MLKLFYVCFYIGIIYTAATFILGYIFDFMGLDGDIGFDCFLQVRSPHFCKIFSPGTGGEFLCKPSDFPVSFLCV